MKLLSTFLFATTRAQSVSYEDCADVALPDGAESLQCQADWCKVICPAGSAALGKKKIKCKFTEAKGFFWPNKPLDGCVKCEELQVPEWANARCKTPNDGGFDRFCQYQCKDLSQIVDMGDLGQKAKVFIRCACPKDKQTKKRVCNWTHKLLPGEPVTQEMLDGIGCVNTSTTQKPLPVSTIEPTEPTDSTQAPTGDTTEMSTVPTTVPTQTTTTNNSNSGDCTPREDGHCGNPWNIDVYQSANFEGIDTIFNDSHLNHITHIDENTFVGSGVGLESNWEKRNGLVFAVERCANIQNNDIDLAKPDPFNCNKTYKWVWGLNRKDKEEQMGYIATSPDKSYVMASGVIQNWNLSGYKRWLVKLDAQTGAEIWRVILPESDAGAGKFSGYESLAFTPDGGLIAGGFGNAINVFPSFKSGGQVEFGTPLFQKIPASVVNSTTKPKNISFEWTFECNQANGCSEMAVGSVKTMKLYNDNGVNKIAATVGAAPNVVILNADTGALEQYKNIQWNNLDIQDVRPLMQDGAVTGFGITGLQRNTIPKGVDECISNSGCQVTMGHTSMLTANLEPVWNYPFNDFTGGTGDYLGLTSGNGQMVLTECWGLEVDTDANGNAKGLIAACGQGVEGCDAESLADSSQALQDRCKTDPRSTWRGTVTYHDLNGNMLWYRNDGHRAFEFVDRGPDGRIVLLSDNPTGFGFQTMALN